MFIMLQFQDFFWQYSSDLQSLNFFLKIIYNPCNYKNQDNLSYHLQQLRNYKHVAN